MSDTKPTPSSSPGPRTPTSRDNRPKSRGGSSSKKRLPPKEIIDLSFLSDDLNDSDHSEDDIVCTHVFISKKKKKGKGRSVSVNIPKSGRSIREDSPDDIEIVVPKEEVKEEVKEEDKPEVKPDESDEEDDEERAQPVQNLLSGQLGEFEGDTDLPTAAQNLGLDEDDYTIPGMSVPLMPHQVIGVDWMVQKERDERYKGGVLGDEMGIGKTVQALGMILKNKSRQRDNKRTLIVVPNNILLQWEEEIKTKTKLKVIKYHGTDRHKKENQMRAADVGLSTFDLVWRDGEVLVKEPDNPRKHAIKGLLYKIPWYRIILDEATVIRNRHSLTARCIKKLDAELRWSMTGTPLHNKLSDFAAYLEFMGFMTWKQFEENIEVLIKLDPQRAMRRLQAFLRKCMLRRTKTSYIQGVPILNLPEKTIENYVVELSSEERMIYDAMETAARVVANTWYKEGKFLKYRKAVYAMLTRLRQACCHPWLLAASEEWLKANPQGIPVLAKDMAFDEDIDRNEQLARAMAFFPAGGLRPNQQNDDDDDVRTEEETDEHDRVWEDLGEPAIDKKVRDEDGEDHDFEDDSWTKVQVEELLNGRRKRKAPYHADRRYKGNASRNINPDLPALLDADINDLKESCKMMAIQSVLDQWDMDDPTRKTLIFCTFVQMIRLVGIYLTQKRIKYCSYIGPMKIVQREAALKSFADRRPRSPRVMLVSIKCGGVGLNLTSANNVIMLDHPWTRAAESQAIDRVHRIGQERHVQVMRLVVRDSVEERILAMQEQKQKLSDGALGEGGGYKVSAEDIFGLFGSTL